MPAAASGLSGASRSADWKALTASEDRATSAVREGDRARYYWIYPNFMINSYRGVMDTNLVLPLGVDRMEVVFDF